jgi:hypothetical protein
MEAQVTDATGTRAARTERQVEDAILAHYGPRLGHLLIRSAQHRRLWPLLRFLLRRFTIIQWPDGTTKVRR